MAGQTRNTLHLHAASRAEQLSKESAAARSNLCPCAVVEIKIIPQRRQHLPSHLHIPAQKILKNTILRYAHEKILESALTAPPAAARS